MVIKRAFHMSNGRNSKLKYLIRAALHKNIFSILLLSVSVIFLGVINGVAYTEAMRCMTQAVWKKEWSNFCPALYGFGAVILAGLVMNIGKRSLAFLIKKRLTFVCEDAVYESFSGKEYWTDEQEKLVLGHIRKTVPDTTNSVVEQGISTMSLCVIILAGCLYGVGLNGPVMTISIVVTVCMAKGLDFGGVYELFDRVSCWCCPLQGLAELRNLRKFFPDLWKLLMEWDARTWRRFRKDYSVEELEKRFAFEEECLCHTKGTWAGKPFELIDWQEQTIRDVFGTIKPNGYRQFNTAYIEIPKKMGKSELAAAAVLLLTCGDGEERAEIYGCAADRQQASIVFEVAADMVRTCPALNKRVKILASQKIKRSLQRRLTVPLLQLWDWIEQLDVEILIQRVYMIVVDC